MPDAIQAEPASNNNLEKVVVLLAALLTKDIEGLVDKVKVLDPMGLSTPEIAKAASTSEGSVRSALSRIKQN